MHQWIKSEMKSEDALYDEGICLLLNNKRQVHHCYNANLELVIIEHLG